MSGLIYLDTGEIFETDEDGLPVGDPVAALQHAILDDDAHALGQQFAAAPELLRALGWFIADTRFQVAVGGNPAVVDRMIADARAIYTKATGAA